MTLTIDLSQELEAVLKAQALTHGVDPAGYARQVLEARSGPGRGAARSSV
jgi:hypothetical protein